MGRNTICSSVTVTSTVSDFVIVACDFEELVVCPEEVKTEEMEYERSQVDDNIELSVAACHWTRMHHELVVRETIAIAPGTGS